MNVLSRAEPSECASVAPDCTAEANLVRRAQQGDDAATREIIQQHHRRVYHFVWHLTRQSQDAEDITQETFIKAFRSLHRFEPGRPLANWLFTIARRTALNHFRGARPWVELSEETASGGASPACRAEERDEVADLWGRARAALPARDFEVLWLRFGENLTVEETARVTGLTQTHVKVLVFRARRRLLKLTAMP